MSDVRCLAILPNAQGRVTVGYAQARGFRMHVGMRSAFCRHSGSFVFNLYLYLFFNAVTFKSERNRQEKLNRIELKQQKEYFI